MKEVTFYFDYSSPFSYLGATQIERVAGSVGAGVRWEPIFLGALFQRIGTPLVPLFSFPEVKQRYVWRDLRRWADHWGVAFEQPSTFPIRTLEALRLTLAVRSDSPERVGRLALALYTAYWADDRRIDAPEVVREIALANGIDQSTIERALAPEPQLKQALVDATEAAAARGVFGVPTFVVGEELFLGQDRLDFVARALGASG